MIGSTRRVRVFAYDQPTDMRCSFDGLYALVVSKFGKNPLDGDMFLFVSRDRRRAKVLFWDGTGLCLYCKRLEKGVFSAPWCGPASKPLELTSSELSLYLEGSRLAGKVALSPPEFMLDPV